MKTLVLAHKKFTPFSQEKSDCDKTNNMSAARKQEFLQGRGLIRSLAGSLLKCSPNEPILAYQGKKLIITKPVKLNLSISHSSDYFACALSTESVGVDLELANRKVNINAIAKRYFHDLELNWLKNEHQALKLWVAKEACIKFYGTTIANNLGKFAFNAQYELIDSSLKVQIWEKYGCIIACASVAGDFELGLLI